MKPLLCIFIFAGISIVSTAFAAVEYTPIVDIPRLNGNALSTEQYVQAVYFLAITAAALIAVVKIIYAGVQYMLDGIVTHKEQAKKEIWGAVFGLAIILTAVLVLNTINPHLTTLDIFANAPSLKDISASKDDGDSATREVNIGDEMTWNTAGVKSMELEPSEFEAECSEDPNAKSETTVLSATTVGTSVTVNYLTSCVAK